KRVCDFTAAAVLLLVSAPILAIAAVLIVARMGPPVLFWQRRIGEGGREFQIVKLRTMLDSRDADGNLLPDDARLTRLGRLLRSLSVDELPELWNVLRGDMSLVGPRPLLPEYLAIY